MKMKGINDLFCSSPASTAVCLTTTDQRSLLPPLYQHGGSVNVGGRAIDRHNPHLRDRRRTGAADAPSSSSSQPQSLSQPLKLCSKHKQHRSKKKSRAPPPTSNATSDGDLINNTTPPTSSSSSSSRYLLAPDHSDLFDILTEFQPLPTSLPSPKTSTSSFPNPDPHPQQTSSNSLSSTDDHQVVVLRVSLHCKGCERKVRKHISQVKGVTSFDIDFFKKKVTVMGDVTPLGVLASISRVKNAQFWPSLSSSSPMKSK